MTDEPTREQRGPAREDRSPAEQRMEAALGPEIASDAVEAAGNVAEGPRRDMRKWLIVAIAAVVALQAAAFFIFPPKDTAADANDTFDFPKDAITANFEFPAPHTVANLSGQPLSTDIVTFQPSISSSLLTSWILMAVIVILFFVMSRRIRIVPGGRQNALEYVYEGLANFATSLGGPAARRYVPIFVALFVFILLSNWSGLLPFVGRTEQLRAPTSDVNVTIGLALVAFALFHIEGVRVLGFRGYFGKFFTLSGFKEGIGAGIIGLVVGVLEFFLEFVKPVTLSMRLFGNIYAGEVALGVITALTIAVIPVVMVGLEVLLNFMQALIFAILTLMFTLAAIEPHHEEAHEGPKVPEGNMQPDVRHGAASPA
ncbi:MAG: F0F1 ATP synthase subunit A [Chloroflexi bacterium]|nr:F0F1 ATP synthase subunit A [Chloroflexota bacterium]